MKKLKQFILSIPYPARITFLFIFLLEILSFYGWLIPRVGDIVFILTVLGVLALSLKDLRYGIAITFAELIIGSQGYLVSFGVGDLALSLRIGIFLAVMTATALSILRDRKIEFLSSKYRWWLLLILGVIINATLRGLYSANGWANVFFDGNAYLFFFLVVPFWQAIKKREDLLLLIQTGIAAMTTSTIKVLFLLYLFSHDLWWCLPEVYRWVRDTRIGEITVQVEPFYRIFFQSQIYVLFAYFFLILYFIFLMKKESAWAIFRKKGAGLWHGFLILLISSIIISLSRSFWLGGAIGLFVLFLTVLWYFREKWQPIKITVLISLFATIVSLILITGVVLVPFPPTGNGFSTGSLIRDRFKEQAAVSSRWNLLGPLWQETKDHWILGSGFGEEVTYFSDDPRIRAQSPNGEYTTMAFEWGYLELWLKLGLIGLVIYTCLILVFFKDSLFWLKQLKEKESTDFWLAAGFLISGISLLIIHTFSPYLNHPLGIGFLLVWALFMERLHPKKLKKT